MPAPKPSLPSAHSPLAAQAQLAVNVERVGPATPAAPPTPRPQARRAPRTIARGKIRRSFDLPADLIARAQRAQLISDDGMNGHRSLTALVTEAIDREIARIAAVYNGGLPIEPHTGQYRNGPKPDSHYGDRYDD